MGTPYITRSEVQSMGEIYFEFSENVDASTFEYGDFTVTVNGTVVPVTHIWNGGFGRVSLTTNPPVYQGIWDVDVSYNASSGTANSIRSDSTGDPVASFSLNNISNMSSVMPLQVSSITRVDTSPTNASTVNFSVVFSERVSTYTVDSSDFQLTTTGSASGYVSTPTTSDFGTTWIVPITGVSGDGTIRLDLKSSGTGIASAMSYTAISGGYTSGQTYSVDHSAPSVTGVSSSTANGTYTVGDIIAVTVSFSESVTVTGTPQLTLETGTTDRVVNYLSGSGTNTLTFNYTVQAGDTSADLDYLSTGALSLNGGTIRDATGNNATLTLASPGATGSLGANKVLVIDAEPTITSATYDASTGVLTVTGTNLATTAGATNDIDVSKLTLSGGSWNSYTLTSSNVELTNSTSFSVTLNSADQLNVNGLLNKNGTSSVSGATYNIGGLAGWDVAVNLAADTTGNGVTVSNVSNPTITSATFDAMTGALNVWGSNLVRGYGATDDITVSALSITGEGGTTRTLTSTDVEIVSGSSFSVTLNATDLDYIKQILNKNGTSSSGGTTYNLAAADDWNTVIGNTDISDSSNPISVSNVGVPTITGATYNGATGALVVTGSGFTQRSGSSNDIIANKLTLLGNGNSAHTLTDTANVDISSGTSFTLILSLTDKAAVNLLLNQNGNSSSGGTVYNLAAGEDWAAGADASVLIADLTGNGITVSNAVDSIAPSAPSTPDLDSGSDSGSSSTDNLTNDTTPTFSGTSEANAAVRLYDAASTLIGSTIANGSGIWSITSSTLSAGAHTMTATATDSANNTSSASSSLAVTIDVTTPILQSTTPTDNATSVGIASNIILSFSEDIAAVAGKSLKIYKTAGNTLVESIAVNDVSKATVVSGTVTIDPTATLIETTGYYVLVDSGAFVDAAGNAYGGIASTTGFNFTTLTSLPPPPANTAPTLSLSTPLDNATDVAVDATIVLTFSEAVRAGSGNIIISSIPDSGNTADIRTIAIGDPQISINGSTLTVNLANNLQASSAYHVCIDQGALTDMTGLAYAGITSATALNFVTASRQATEPYSRFTDTDHDGFPDALESLNGLTIGAKDNEVITRNDLFVQQLYRDILYREADTDGLSFWTQVLDHNQLSRETVVSAFISSHEFQDIVGSVARLYFGALDRMPDQEGLYYWVDARHTDASLSAIGKSFANSGEFLNLYGGLDDAGFVVSLYNHILNREADSPGLQYWQDQMAAGLSKGEILTFFTNSPEFESNSQPAVISTLTSLDLLGALPDASTLDGLIQELAAGTPLIDVIGVMLSSEQYHDRFM